MKKQQTGFTLIELVVVIVILGILAATALPRFVDIGGDARLAVMRSVEGSMRAANAMIYARAATTGVVGLANSTVTLNGQVINIRYGFATTADQLRLAMDLSPAADFDTTTNANQVRHTGARQPQNCRVNYVAATATQPANYNQTNLTNCG